MNQASNRDIYCRISMLLFSTNCRLYDECQAYFIDEAMSIMAELRQRAYRLRKISWFSPTLQLKITLPMVK